MDQLSIATTFAERERLEQQVKQIWEKLAAQLQALIPSGLHLFANEHGWIKQPLDTWWQLPELLGHLVTNTRMGGCCSKKVQVDELALYGFTSFDDLEAKFHELEQAWPGLIRIEVDRGESHRVEIRFYAAEIEQSTNP